MDRPLSEQWHQRARGVLPGGVNSPVRSFASVGGLPVVAARAAGPCLWDVDGNRYVDYIQSWGASILGHAHPAVVEAVCRAAAEGSSFGLSTPGEVILAERIREAVPSLERVRFVNSGTEAVMTAVRLARAVTGRDLVLKFAGGYHGHSDGLLVRAGSGLATLSLPASAGVPAEIAAGTLTARYNDPQSVDEHLRTRADDLACILVEPVAGNMGVVPAEPGFLEHLRETCDRIGAVLIFDEIITGFRIDWGGAQQAFGVRPDLTTLGKIIGGGLPVGAVGGRREIMDGLAPQGEVYQAGTLSGNPLVVAAGNATLKALQEAAPYEDLRAHARRLADGLEQAARAAGVAVQLRQVGSMLTVFFSDEPARDFDSSQRADAKRYARFFHAMRERGVLLPPSQWESWFVSTAHREEPTLEATLDAARYAFARVAP